MGSVRSLKESLDPNDDSKTIEGCTQGLIVSTLNAGNKFLNTSTLCIDDVKVGIRDPRVV